MVAAASAMCKASSFGSEMKIVAGSDSPAASDREGAKPTAPLIGRQPGQRMQRCPGCAGAVTNASCCCSKHSPHRISDRLTGMSYQASVQLAQCEAWYVMSRSTSKSVLQHCVPKSRHLCLTLWHAPNLLKQICEHAAITPYLAS